MTIDKLLKTMDEHKVPQFIMKDVVRDFKHYRKDKHLELENKHSQYGLIDSFKNEICDDYAFRKVVLQYKL